MNIIVVTKQYKKPQATTLSYSFSQFLLSDLSSISSRDLLSALVEAEEHRSHPVGRLAGHHTEVDSAVGFHSQRAAAAAIARHMRRVVVHIVPDQVEAVRNRPVVAGRSLAGHNFAVEKDHHSHLEKEHRHNRPGRPGVAVFANFSHPQCRKTNLQHQEAAS